MVLGIGRSARCFVVATLVLASVNHVVAQAGRGDLSLGGTIISALDGLPLADAQVDLAQDMPDGGTLGAGARTDAEGRFLFAGLHSGCSCELVVLAPGHALAVLAVEARADADPELSVVLDPEQVLAGSVVDAQGAPVAGAPVELHGDRVVGEGEDAPTWESRAGLSATTTDAAGRFRFAQLYAGAFTVLATHPAHAFARASLQAPAGREDLQLVLDPRPGGGVTLVGHATSEPGGAPVTLFEVQPLSLAGDPLADRPQVFEEPTGAFRITGLPLGELLVRAHAPGFADWQARLTAPAPGERQLDIRFAEPRSLLLSLASMGLPAPGRVSFRDSHGLPVHVQVGDAGPQAALHTDADGRLLVRGLPADDLTVTVRPDSGMPAQSWAVDLRSVRDSVIELQLQPPTTGSVHVLVLGAADEQPPPPAGTTVASFVATLPQRLQSGLVWPLERDVRVSVRMADGSMLDELCLDVLASDADLAATLALLPEATRPITARLDVATQQAASLAVQAKGYAPFSQPLTWERGATEVDVIVLLRRQPPAPEPPPEPGAKAKSKAKPTPKSKPSPKPKPPKG